MSKKPDVNWKALVKFGDMECRCHCGSVFHSMCKYVIGHGLISYRDCPGCGRWDNLCGASSDWEPMTIDRKPNDN